MGGVDVEYVWNENFTLDSVYARRRTAQDSRKRGLRIKKRAFGTAPSESDEIEYEKQACSGNTDLSSGSSSALPPIRQSDLAAAVLAARAEQDEAGESKQNRFFLKGGGAGQKHKHFQLAPLRRGSSSRRQRSASAATDDLRFAH